MSIFTIIASVLLFLAGLLALGLLFLLLLVVLDIVLMNVFDYRAKWLLGNILILLNNQKEPKEVLHG